MSKILVITDQPNYTHSASFMAGHSFYIQTIFAGDIIDNVFEELRHISTLGYDSVLYPETITTDMTGVEKINDFIVKLSKENPHMKVHYYSNQY